MKRVVLLIIAIATISIAVIVLVLDKNPMPALGIGLLALFLVYALWSPPEKHRDYSLSDQQQATSRALGGGGGTDLLDTKPKEQGSKRKEKR